MSILIESLRYELNQSISKYNLLNHPFYLKWSEGTLTLEQLREYAKQYYQFVKHFPRLVSTVHSNCEDGATRAMLMQNLADEEGYKSEYKNHPALWMDFALALGLTPEEVNACIALKETDDLIAGMYQLARSSESTTGLASLYAYESQVPEVALSKIEGLKKYYGITTPESLAYFKIHAEYDVWHSNDELQSILSGTSTETQREQVIYAAETSAALQWKFLDGIYHTYCMN
ncbi:MAG: CADD family putative folate metabolism protein [Saprospiraceae bacterium]|nr:CADD family putative folate metabolism protein [Saprospiraceae bacterium]